MKNVKQNLSPAVHTDELERDGSEQSTMSKQL